MERLDVASEINGIDTSLPVTSDTWLALSKAIFGPIGQPDTSQYARTRLVLPDGSDRELAVGYSTTSKTGKLITGEDKDDLEFGIWIPTKGVSEQQFLTQPTGWFEEGYRGIIFRTTAGVLRAGAQSIGLIKGRQAEAATLVKKLTTHTFDGIANPVYDLDEDDEEEAEDDEEEAWYNRITAVLGHPNEKQLRDFDGYARAVRRRLCEVAFTNGL